MKRISHKGFTLAQLVIAMIIFAILCGIGVAGYQHHVKRANIEEVSSELRIWANNFEYGISNSGWLEFKDGFDEHAEDKFEDYIREFEDLYMNCSFDESTISMITTSDTKFKVFSVETKPEEDPWGNRYRMMYAVSATTGEIDTVYFASAGPDAVWQNGCDTNSYIVDGITSDDIVMVLNIRETTR